MRWICVWLGLASLAVATAASSCSINRRSGQYECEVTADCDPGRTCSDGLCVTAGGGPDAPPADGPKRDAPPSACPSQCTQCEGKTCIIDCAAPGANCGAQVVCPPGFACDVRCSLQGSCRAGVLCTGATSCTVQCTGRGSCRGVLCGAGPCNVDCSGMSSCETVSCGPSCACDVKCAAFNGSCLNVQCNNIACDTGRGCSSTQFPVCDSCP
ncbi:MAG TPA: hypothetical protein VK932_16105 [Kofleriaceae bacterium]|nr:hypothetical protein [Kofleriaceae bacterium]